MTLAIPQPDIQNHVRLAYPTQEEPLIKRLNTDNITDNERRWILRHVAETLPFDEGRCNLNQYVRINQYYDVEEIIGSPNMRKLYKEHGAKTGRVREIDLYDFSNFTFVERVQNSKEDVTACFVLEGTPTLEYKSGGFHIPINLQEGNIVMWNSRITVGFDDLKSSRVVIYGIR